VFPPAPPKKFCAAPWLESVLYNNGSYRICSRNSRVFGDWRERDLEEIWKGGELQEFRRRISTGSYPDQDCAACHSAGTQQSLERVLSTPLQNCLRFLVYGYLILFEEYLDLQKISELFSIDAPDAAKKIARYEELIKTLLFRFRLEGHGAHLAKLKKIQNIVVIVKAFHEGAAIPPLVAPFRQVQLIAKCNARCVMCPGKFNGEIETGGSIDSSELEQAMSHSGHIVDFFCNGSEFLLFQGWKEVAQKLRSSGVASLRLSTNGMLLTKSNAEYLVNEGVVGHLNISVNAGTKETLERVQKNVRWDRLLENVNHLIDYAEAKKVHFPLSFSFIVMRSNFHELPAFLSLVAGWAKKCKALHPKVMIMSLENAGDKDYRFFLFDEHPAFAPKQQIEQAFREAHEIAEREGMFVSLYNFGSVKSLPEFVRAGLPIPEFFAHESADRENIEIRVRRILSPFFQKEFELAQKDFADLAAIDRAVRRLSEIGPGQVAVDGVKEFQPLFQKFPHFLDYFHSYFAQWRNHLCLRLRGDLEVAGGKRKNHEDGISVQSL